MCSRPIELLVLPFSAYNILSYLTAVPLVIPSGTSVKTKQRRSIHGAAGITIRQVMAHSYRPIRLVT